jgi:hypothetical protein
MSQRTNQEYQEYLGLARIFSLLIGCSRLGGRNAIGVVGIPPL